MASDNRKDEDIVRLTLSGSKEAFGILYDRYFSNALRIARRIVSDGEQAKELTQESFLEAYLSLEHLKKPEAFRSWIFAIVGNVCKSHIRQRSGSFLSPESLTGGSQYEGEGFLDPQQILEYGQLRRIVFDAVNGLSAQMREPVRLFYYEQLTIREIAASMGISLSAVKVRLFRARLYLREILYRLLGRHSFEKYMRGRGRRMLNASILDVVQSEEAGAFIILLMDERKRVLPIYVGEAEGMAIALGLKKYSLPRPLMHDLAANLLESIDAEITKVHVEALKESTFYGVVFVKGGDTEKQIDARPSDAIALSLRRGSPIYVAEEVMEKAGMEIPEEEIKMETKLKGMDSIIEQIEKKIRRPKKGKGKKKTESTKEIMIPHVKSILESQQ